MNPMAQTQETMVAAFNWLQDHVANLLVNAVIAVIILLVGFAAGRFVGKLIDKILAELSIDRLFRLKGKLSPRKIIAELVTFGIYFFTIVVAFNQLGITSAVFYTIIGAILIVALASFSISSLDFLPNFISYLKLVQKKPFGRGDIIKTGKVAGKVQKIGYHDTHIVTESGDAIYIPNVHFDTNAVHVLNKKDNGKENAGRTGGVGKAGPEKGRTG